METILRSPVFLLIVLAFSIMEWVWRTKFAKHGYDVGAAAASFGLAAGNFILKPVSAIVIVLVYGALSELTPLKLSIIDWRVWVVGFVAVEFVYYWFHRWSHTVRWLWATHAVHHSANEMTLPAAIRLGWTSVFSGGFLLFAPLVLLGFPPVMIGALLSANLAYQFFLHTEAVGKLGPLEWVLNTPAHHRLHHASNPEYIDKNFGGVVIVFDRMFGTLAHERPDTPVRYGLVHPLKSRNPFVIAFHEWVRLGRDLKNARNVAAVWRAVAGRPQ
jgi:sterol desaturase/sphingolipid hydroxylase (fatty acid hydroxylase superfamily)